MSYIKELVFDDDASDSAVRITVDGIDVGRGQIFLLHDQEDIVLRQRRRAHTGERIFSVEFVKRTDQHLGKQEGE